MAVFTQKRSQQRNYMPNRKGKRAGVVLTGGYKISGADVVKENIGGDHEIDQQRLLI
ncbi:hypothetical protein PanWU01x14_360050 [Parasponia andersonii]|uniref:Uncharacterized protein n=1 Tax=Parasponia andersonii TaxID=3476 RepID=A0A2P5A7T7_PARAD|nr:hypothetical protein PanWU01x14_360050 [Parasponia andersonii]